MTELYQKRFGGLARLYGDAALPRLHAARVAVIGLGGVGSWAAEALARSGVGHLTLVDLDEVCHTNTNRQLPALASTFGRLKVEVVAERLRDINPEIDLNPVAGFFNARRAEELLGPAESGAPGPCFDAVIDAIDSVTDKAALVAACRERGLPLIVSGGAGGRTDPTQVRRSDLGRAGGDALLKALKQRLKKDGAPEPGAGGLWQLPVVYSPEVPVKPWEVCRLVAKPGEDGASGRLGCADGYGAAAFVTGAFGFALAAWALDQVLGRPT